MSVLAAGLGLAVGLALGALGGGGSVLAVPSLVYLLGQSPHQATTASMIIVLVSSLAGLTAHARAGHVRVRDGLAFGMAGLLTSLISSAMAGGLPESVLLSGFAVVMAAAAVMMWRSGAGAPSESGERRSGESLLVRSIAAGGLVGVLIGIFGVGGGFLAVPALVSVVGLGMAEAVGTSLLVIALNAAAALAVRFTGSAVDWAVVLPFALSAALAAVAGQRVAHRFRAVTLQRGFAVLLLVLAVWVIVDQAVLH